SFPTRLVEDGHVSSSLAPLRGRELLRANGLDFQDEPQEIHPTPVRELPGPFLVAQLEADARALVSPRAPLAAHNSSVRESGELPLHVVGGRVLLVVEHTETHATPPAEQ